MRRRGFMRLVGGATLVAPAGARAQQPGKVNRVGFLWENPETFPEAMAAFREELHRLGYVEGRNLVIEFRWAEGKPDRMRVLAEELVRLPVDVAQPEIQRAICRPMPVTDIGGRHFGCVAADQTHGFRSPKVPVFATVFIFQWKVNYFLLETNARRGCGALLRK